MQTTTRVQTAFRLDTALLNRLKRKAKAKGQSLNAFVEDILTKATPADLQWPGAATIRDISPETRALTRNYKNFTDEELKEDDRLAYIFGK